MPLCEKHNLPDCKTEKENSDSGNDIGIEMIEAENLLKKGHEKHIAAGSQQTDPRESSVLDPFVLNIPCGKNPKNRKDVTHSGTNHICKETGYQIRYGEHFNHKEIYAQIHKIGILTALGRSE